MYSRKFLFIVPVLIAFIALSLLFLSLDPPVLAHTVTVNANPADWPMAAPGQVNLGHIGRDATHQGEYIWRDNPNDQRTDWGGNEQADLLEFRVTADSANLYFMAVMSDITQLGGNGVPQIQVAIDTDRVSGSGEPWLGSLSDTQVSPNAEWEYLLITRFGSGYSNLVVWQNGYVTQIFTGTAAISDTINTIEFSVPWAALEMSAPPTLPLRLTVATFRANASDETWDSSGNSDAVDAITNYGDPGSTANTWSEVSDGVVNYYFDLFFEPDGDVYPPLLISEVLYDPSGAEPGSEFIEIINISPMSIGLSNFKVGDEETADSTEGIRLFGSGSIAPGQVIVWANNAGTFTTTYGFLPDYAQNNTGYPAVILTPNYPVWSTGSINLANAGDEVLLLDGSDTVMDVVVYGTSSWPGVSNNITVGNGQSMERTPANWDTNDITLDFMMRPNDGTPKRFILSTDLRMVKTSTDGNDDALQFGERIYYTIVISNRSGISLTNVTVTDVVPLGAAQYVPGSIAGGDTQSDADLPTLRWTVANLWPATPVTLTFAITNNQAISGTAIVNTAWATSTEIYAPVRAMVTDTVVQFDLAVFKYAEPEPAVAGMPLTYTIVIRNLSPYTTTGVILTDTLHLSTTLQTINQRDQDAADFALGTHNNTRWNDDRPQYDEWLEQVSPALPGDYTSRVFDAGQDGAIWDTLSWLPRRPYWKPLPNNNGAEWDYDDGNADMWGNRLLLHLDDAGAPFADSSGNGLSTACITCPVAGADGRFNTALAFDGALSQTVVISDAANSTRYAIELWVYPTTVTTSTMILRTDTISGVEHHYSHMLGILGNRFFHMVNDGGERWAVGTTTIVPNTWYHVVGTAESGGDLRLYVNGVQEAVVHRLGALWAGGDHDVLGSTFGLTGTAAYFSGRLDEVAVYTRTLASSEVLAHYLRGALRAQFEVRSCAQADCSDGTWAGPYSEQSNTALTPPTLSISVPANRYFQYRVALETDQPDYRPQIEWVQTAPAHYQVVTTQGRYTTTADGKAFTCTIGTLAPGGSVTITAWVDIARNFTGTITNTVWVTAAGDLDIANNTAQVTSTVESHVDINVYKYDEYWVNNQTLVGGDPVNPGYPITYTLVAYNRGPSDAWDVTITDTLPVTITNVITPGGWAVCEWTTHTLTCTTPHLPYEAWRRIVVEAIAPLVTGTVTNTAWITVESSLALTTTSRFSDTEVTTIWPLADLIIGKTAEPSPAYPGETITYTLTITNVGPSDVPTPVVVDEFLSGEQVYASIISGWTCTKTTASRIECVYSGILTAGSSASLQITTTAPLTGVVDNRALAADWLVNTTDPDWDNNLVYLHTAVLPTADLVVTKTVVSDTVVAGAPLTYTITIRNAGPVDAGAAEHTLELQSLHGQDWQGRNRAVPYHSMIHVRGFEGRIENITVTLGYVDDPYPADLRLLLVGPNGQAVLLMANAGGGTDIEDLVLTLNDAGQLMPISDTLTSTVIYRPTNHGFGGDLPLPAPAGPYGSSLGAFVGSSPNGQWRLYVYDAVADAGGFLEYWTLTLTTRTTDTVTLEDILPAGLSDVRLTGRPADWDCAVSSQNVACEFDRLPVGAVTVITLTATAPITPGVITNTAHITSTTLDPITTTNTAWVTATVIPVADIQIVKTVMPTGRVGQGAPLTYTLTITNLGPGLAVAPIVVTDHLPIELTTVITGGAGWSCDLTALPVLTCTRSSDLSVNGVSVLTLRATAPLTSGLVLTNTAGVSGASFDPITANNTSLITLTVAPQANLGVIKMVEPALALPGDLLTYTVIVTNYGPSAAVYVTLTDRIQNATLGQPSGGTCTQAGNTFTCTIAALNPLSMTTIVVTATAPASNGLITNTAWVTSGIEDLQPGNNTYTSILPVTQRPVANAGADQTVRPLATVTLNGSGSYDPDNNLPLAYGWTQTGGPAITLSSATAVSPTFTAPAVPAVITLSLRVTDSLGAPCLVPDVVVITVTNRPPVADAGADQTVYVAASVMLNGGGSSDPDGDLPLTYSWTQTGGPAVTLSSATVVSPTFTAPATPAVLTFTLRVTDSFGMPDPTPDEVVVTVGDRPIVGLQAFNDSPTFLGQTTHLWATVVTGTNITYQWAFGDGQTGSGISVTHAYAAEGWYTAIVTAANSAGSITATTLISITEFPTMTIYLPIVMRNYASAPDLAVEQIAVTANSIQVVVRNVGDMPIDKTLANEFWVDVYINPNTPPATVNQTWRHVGSSGIVWGVTQDALPLAPGQAITLTVTPAGGLYYRADLSSVAWPLSAGARIYAQADSAHSATAYGAILENHEIIGAPYLNNIMGPTVLSTAAPTRTRSSRR